MLVNRKRDCQVSNCDAFFSLAHYTRFHSSISTTAAAAAVFLDLKKSLNLSETWAFPYDSNATAHFSFFLFPCFAIHFLCARTRYSRSFYFLHFCFEQIQAFDLFFVCDIFFLRFLLSFGNSRTMHSMQINGFDSIICMFWTTTAVEWKNNACSKRMASKKYFFVIHLKRMWFLLLYSALKLELNDSAAAAAAAATNQNNAMLFDIKTGTCVILF